MRLHFDRTRVERLLAHSVGSAARSPTLGQLYEGACRRDGTDVAPGGGGRPPSADDADPAKIGAGLWLVGDEGVYLMSNGKPGLTRPDGGSTIAMALETRGGDPNDVKRASFGEDDGADFLDQEMVEGLLRLGDAAWVCLDLTRIGATAVAPLAPPPVGARP